MSSDTLVVPVNVEALCVSKADADAAIATAPAAADFTQIPDGAGVTAPYLSETFMRKPFSDDGVPRVPGVHLHWALPDALTRATNVYRVTGRAINELRLLGLPTEQLAALLRHLASANPHVAPAVAEIARDPATFQPGAWVQIASPDLVAGPEFASADALIGLPTATAGTMRDVLGDAAAARYRPVLVRGTAVGRFPAMPDRWLVARTITGSADLTSWHAWIVESDFLTTDAGDCFAGLGAPPSDDPRVACPEAYATTVPAPTWEAGDAPSPGPPYRFMGRAVELASWSEDPSAERMTGLDALGYGLPTFSASYPDSRTVLGLCDAFTALGKDWSPADPGSSRIGYLVVGWHSDPADDPLRRPRPAGTTMKETLAGLGWEAGGDPSPALARTLYSGLVNGIEWQRDARYGTAVPGTGTDPSTGTEHGTDDATVVIASTAAEALATQLASGSAAGDATVTTADLLEALQLGLLDTLVTAGVDALPALESALHESGFSGRPAGSVWGVVPAGAATGVATPAQATLPDALAGDLDALNVLQRSYDQQLDVVAEKRSRLFAAWHLFLQLSVAPPGESQPDTDLREARLKTLRHLLLANTGDASGAGTLPPEVAELSKRYEQVADALATLGAQIGPGLTLTPTPAPRYWQPNEPVLLVTGPVAQPSQRYGGDRVDRASGLLHCRALDQVLSASGLAELSAGPDWPLAAARSPGLEAWLRAACTTLLDEALLLDWGMPLPAAVPDRTKLREALEADAASPDPSYAFLPAFSGYPPSRLAVNDRAAAGLVNPWHPIALHWQVRVRPQEPIADPADAYSPSAVTGAAKLAPGAIELEPASPPADTVAAQQYEGVSVLTARATQTLASRAQAFLGMGNIPPALEQPLTAWATRATPALSQALSGLNDAVLMRTQQPQLRVFSPDAPGWSRQVGVWVGTANRGAPMAAGGFAPLRFGALKLDRLRVVDALGQVCEVNLPATGPTVAPSLAFAESVAPKDFTVALRPRITQPARLLLRWVAAYDDSIEANDHPATSPVCGWLMANHLDASLMVFDASGAVRGELRVLGSDPTPTFLPAPGANAAAALVNKHLGAFVDTVRTGPSSRFTALLRTLERVCETIEPGSHRQDDALAVLMGRPLALARASIGLDVQGLYANDQGVAALDRAGTDYDFAAIAQTHGFEGVELPVRLGDLGLDGDGLVGYFADDQYDTFCAEDEAAGLQLSLAGGPELVSLVVDPRAQVHATTGALPLQSIALPPDQYAAALQALEFSFLVNPVVGHAARGDVALPLPAEAPTASWQWLERARDATWQTIARPGPARASADLDVGPRTVREGWLAMRPDQEDPAT